jgi:hypothetical protein
MNSYYKKLFILTDQHFLDLQNIHFGTVFFVSKECFLKIFQIPKVSHVKQIQFDKGYTLKSCFIRPQSTFFRSFCNRIFDERLTFENVKNVLRDARKAPELSRLGRIAFRGSRKISNPER